MPRSARNFSNSSCTDTSKVSNFKGERIPLSLTIAYEERKEDTHLRADVKPTPLPVCFGRQLRGELSVLVERDVVCYERAILAHGINSQCASAAISLYPGVVWSASHWKY